VVKLIDFLVMVMLLCDEYFSYVVFLFVLVCSVFSCSRQFSNFMNDGGGAGAGCSPARGGGVGACRAPAATGFYQPGLKDPFSPDSFTRE
jgi:hypothetical protein